MENKGKNDTTVKLKFRGIDSFNRPVFYSKTHGFFGSTEVLFGASASESEVLEKISEKDLVWFGYSFDCEPLGTRIKPGAVEIVNKAKSMVGKKVKIKKEYCAPNEVNVLFEIVEYDSKRCSIRLLNSNFALPPIERLNTYMLEFIEN
jgi:hypothetical protein